MTTQTQSAVTPEFADQKLRTFAGLVEAIEEFCNVLAQRQAPLKDATDYDSTDVAESLNTIASQSTFLVRGSCEHLRAFTRSVQQPVLSIAPVVCLRSSLESSAIATWLTDQAVTREVKIARSFAFRFEGLVQQAKYIGQSDPILAAEIQSRLDVIEAKALRMGMQSARNASGKLTMIAPPWLGSTEIIRTA